ncbi:hypothetical protein [uncultured Methanobacterium sp.]|uniref:hypothetical protein n=1 Tax=uncultured Methanobacterium sp. TaxID=176306 RepID=UPI002AA6245A|nr:hypothetical protein [uncultured Methanobacterium sp.]
MKDNIKKYRWPVLVLLLIILSGYSGFYVTTAMAFPQNPSTHQYFDKIADMPYVVTQGPHPETFWQQGGDCDDRARTFANYLKSKGADDVQICWVCRYDENGKMIPSYDGGMGHEFVVWHNRTYNPSINQTRRYYDWDLNEYLSSLKNITGFNTFYYENSTQGIHF